MQLFAKKYQLMLQRLWGTPDDAREGTSMKDGAGEGGGLEPCHLGRAPEDPRSRRETTGRLPKLRDQALRRSSSTVWRTKASVRFNENDLKRMGILKMMRQIPDFSH